MASGAGKNIFLTRALEKILADRERGEVKMPHYERPVSQPSVRHYPVYQFRISKSTHKAGGEHSQRLYERGSKLCPPLSLLVLLNFCSTSLYQASPTMPCIFPVIMHFCGYVSFPVFVMWIYIVECVLKISVFIELNRTVASHCGACVQAGYASIY